MVFASGSHFYQGVPTPLSLAFAVVVDHRRGVDGQDGAAAGGPFGSPPPPFSFLPAVGSVLSRRCHCIVGTPKSDIALSCLAGGRRTSHSFSLFSHDAHGVGSARHFPFCFLFFFLFFVVDFLLLWCDAGEASENGRTGGGAVAGGGLLCVLLPYDIDASSSFLLPPPRQLSCLGECGSRRSTRDVETGRRKERARKAIGR